MQQQELILKQTLSQLGLSKPADQIVARLKPQGYAEPDFLAELFQTDKTPLLQDMREACQLSNSDFAKMHLRFAKVYQTVLTQHSQKQQPPSRKELGRRERDREKVEGNYNQASKNSRMQVPPEQNQRSKHRKGRRDSESNSGKSDQELEIEQIIDTVDQINKNSKPLERPIESDDETDDKKQNRRKLCRRGYWAINKVVKEAQEQDKREKLEDQQRHVRYAEQANQYSAQMMIKPSEMAQKQRNIMVKNVQNTLNEISTQGRQGGQVPQYVEHFPKLQREDRDQNVPCIPDFRPLPDFNFKEPPPLRDNRQLVPPDRNTDFEEPIDLDMEIAVFENHGPQEVEQDFLSSERLIAGELNRRKHNPNKSAFILTDQVPSGKHAYKLIDYAALGKGPTRQKPVDDELIIINDRKKPVGGKVDVLNRALAGFQIDQRIQNEQATQSLQQLEGTQKLNSLFEREIGVEDPDVYNAKEKKPKGIQKERYYYGNPMEEKKMFNQLGVLKKATAHGNNAQVVNEIDSQANEGDHGTTTIKPTLKLFHREFVSYFELMKTVIEQKVFDNLGEVGRIMSLTEQTGLKMIEWTLTRADSSILTYRCKRFPVCQARVNFQMYVGGTDKVKLVSTHLKHNHQPDWTASSRIDREVWAVLTHPNVQSKIAQTANKKFGDIDLCYYTAEEAAIVESIDFSCVTRDQFGKFMEIYHCMSKVGGSAGRRNLRSVNEIINRKEMACMFEDQPQHSHLNQSVQANVGVSEAQNLLTTSIQLPQMPQFQIDLDVDQGATQSMMDDVSVMMAAPSNLNSEIPGGRLVVEQAVTMITTINLDLIQEDENQHGDCMEDLELFCESVADCPLAPNAKALQIQQQLKSQFEDIQIACSNDESMLFFSFKEQIAQSAKFMHNNPGGSTMLVQSGFKTQMPGMSLMMFVSQAQSNMNFILMAGCLIIETIAQNNQSRQVNYTWLFQAYAQSKLPQPSVCLTEFNEPLYRAMRKAWPKTQHLWSAFSIIRNGGKILNLQNKEKTEMDARSKPIFDQFSNWITNCTKTKEHFSTNYKALKLEVKQSKGPKMQTFFLYIQRIKTQSNRWATFELANGFDHVTSAMNKRTQGSLFQAQQCLFYGDLILVSKQKYIFKVVQSVLTKQQGVKLSQVIRAFEYLSTFAYQKQLLPVTKITDPTKPPAAIQLQSEQFISKACIDIVDSEICGYFAQKLIGMASKMNSYKIKQEGCLYLIRQEQGFQSRDDCDSVMSQDSDLLTKTSRMEITVTWSSIDQILHCQCNSVKLLGYPCVHLIRVTSYRKQMQYTIKENYAVEYEDIQKYFADHLGKSFDVDILQFDASTTITLDREKHVLAELLCQNAQLLPQIERKQLFENLVQKIKMKKLMSYKPKAIDFDDQELQQQRMQKSFGQQSFLKLTHGVNLGHKIQLEVMLVMIQDLRAKKLTDVGFFNKEVFDDLTRALDRLDNKDFKSATRALKRFPKDNSFDQLLLHVLSKNCRMETNRTCKGYVEQMNFNIDNPEEPADLPVYDVTVNELQKHGFVVSQCLQEKLSTCECGECPSQLEIKHAPKVLFFNLDGQRLTFRDLVLQDTFMISSQKHKFIYRLQMIVLQNNQPVKPGSVEQNQVQTSLLINKPAVAASEIICSDEVKYDSIWPGWFFYSPSNTRSRLYKEIGSSEEDLTNSGYAHPLTQDQVINFISQNCKAQKPYSVLKRHKKMGAYEKRFGVKPAMLIFVQESVSAIEQNLDGIFVDLDNDPITVDLEMKELYLPTQV